MSDSTEQNRDDADALQAFKAELKEIEVHCQGAFEQAKEEHALREVNAKFAGPQGRLTQLMKQMPKLPKENRKEWGQKANALKVEIQNRFDAVLADIKNAERKRELEGPSIDISLPARHVTHGGLHPITQVMHELIDIFRAMGFDIVEGPEVELHTNNFEKLGFPPDHPATDMQDSFYIEDANGKVRKDALLRTHTSNVQVRQMLEREPPLAVVSPGAVFRKDDDATHSPMFFQLEGFVVDKNITMADLKGTLTLFLQRLFGEGIPVRFRPSYFPFVEPGGEVDIGCVFCRKWETKEHAATSEKNMSPCRVCKDSGWLEILGCGMIHPVVFEHVGYDPSTWSGFAFGLGIDRIAMLKFGITHIRWLYDNDYRFLSQF